MVDLSIIVPSLVWRGGEVGELFDVLLPQIGQRRDVELLLDRDNMAVSIGKKMERLNAKACGRYVSAIGDDDMVSDDYVDSLLEGIARDPEPDVVSFFMDWFADGKLHAVLEERLAVLVTTKIFDGRQPQKWLVPVSSKSAVRRGLLHFRYPDISWGEDTAFSRHLVRFVDPARFVVLPKLLYMVWFNSHNKYGYPLQRKLGRAEKR